MDYLAPIMLEGCIELSIKRCIRQTKWTMLQKVKCLTGQISLDLDTRVLFTTLGIIIYLLLFIYLEILKSNNFD